MSASAPAGSEMSIIGNVAEVCTSETISALPVSAVIIQAAATVWISPPKFDAMLENQKRRKIGMRSGSNAECRADGNASQIGRESGRERGCKYVSMQGGVGSLKKTE